MDPKPHHCPCGETDPDKFALKRKSICRVCDNIRQAERRAKRGYQRPEDVRDAEYLAEMKRLLPAWVPTGAAGPIGYYSGVRQDVLPTLWYRSTY